MGRAASPIRKPPAEEEICPKSCLEYKVCSSILRFSDLRILSEVIDHIPINERGFNLAINNLKKLKQKKVDALQELFVLFTQFKSKDSSAIPSEQDMENNALKKVSVFANKHFFYEGDSNSRLIGGQSTEITDNKSWSHPVKGTNPNKILTSLYTSLMYLVKEYCFFNTQRQVTARSLDEVFQHILDTETNRVDGNKKVLMTCRLSLKLLKSLKILPDGDTNSADRT